MKNINVIINNIFKSSCSTHYKNFFKKINEIRNVQENMLLSLVEKNKNTVIGKHLDFSSIGDLKDFRKNVPVTDYQYYEKYIDDIRKNKKNVLTAEKVLLLEPTSGTSGKNKLIPYTASFKKEFQRSVGVWLYDIYANFPGLINLSSYWSVTPPVSQTAEDKNIGFATDSEYLGFLGKLLEKSFAVPSLIKKIRNMDNFKYMTAYFLLKCSDLGLISVWNPSFLLIILDVIKNSYDKLLQNIYDGVISLPVREDISYLKPYIKTDKKRCKDLDKIDISGNNFSGIWKKLTIISCWKDGGASSFINKLDHCFPGVYIQGKGLIATEGIVSFPLINQNGSLCAYTSTFLEFMSADSEIFLIDELKVGSCYKVIITNSGGLYRYDLGDKIIVTDKFKGMPLIKFAGRANVSDIMGEKLDCVSTVDVIETVLKKYNIKKDFILFAPQIEDNSAYYTLFIQSDNIPDPESVKKEIDELLRNNFHYNYARDLGQLKSPRLFLIKYRALEDYAGRLVSENYKLGNIKPEIIDKRYDWKDYFKGSFL